MADFILTIKEKRNGKVIHGKVVAVVHFEATDTEEAEQKALDHFVLTGSFYMELDEVIHYTQNVRVWD